jgi:predicted secreted acid phosphatase
MLLRRTLLVVLALLVVAAPALAATKRTDTPAAELSQQVDSGAYAKSVDLAFARATKQLRAQLSGKAGRGGKKPRKPAVVLDIDETSLSNMGCLAQAGFELSGLATCVVNGTSTAIPAARTFVKLAQKLGARVFFVTGAPEALCPARLKNLRDQGFGGKLTVICRPPTDTGDSVVPYKSGERAAIEKRGATIVVNVGDQRSDLAGGHSRKVVLVPNPVYVID